MAMAEEQVMSSALVLQNANEKLMEKLRNMQLNNLTAKQQSNLQKWTLGFMENFVLLSYSFYGLSVSQLKELDKAEMKELDRLISHKAKPWMIYQMIFTFCVPIIGWMGGTEIGLLEGGFRSCLYLRYKKHLVKNLGEDYFPFTRLLDYLE